VKLLSEMSAHPSVVRFYCLEETQAKITVIAAGFRKNSPSRFRLQESSTNSKKYVYFVAMIWVWRKTYWSNTPRRTQMLETIECTMLFLCDLSCTFLVPNFLGRRATKILGLGLSNTRTFRSRGKVSRRSANEARRSRVEKKEEKKTSAV